MNPNLADARVALARGVVMATAVSSGLLGGMLATRSAVEPSALACAAVLGFGVAPLSWVERAAIRRWPLTSPVWAVWAACFVVLPLVLLQVSYVEAALRVGFGGALEETGRVVARLGRQPVEVAVGTAISCALFGTPLALASHVRARGLDGYTPVMALLLLLSLPLCCASGPTALGLLLGWHLLIGLYAAGDALEERLANTGASAELSAELLARMRSGELSWSRTWLLAYLGVAEARRLLREPPDRPPSDLSVWCRGLEHAGRDVVVRAAAAVGALVLQRLRALEPGARGAFDLASAARALALVDAWLDAEPDLRPALRDQARELRAGWVKLWRAEEAGEVGRVALVDALKGDAGHDAADAARRALGAVVDALEGDGLWSGTAAARALSRAVEHARDALHGDEQAVRAAMRDALIAWAQHGPPSAPPAPAG